MGFIKRKNKKFDYKPRYYKGEGNPYEISHKFDQFRSTTGKRKGLKGKINSAISELNGNDSHSVEYGNETYELQENQGSSNKMVVYIIIVLVLVFLFLIDFDLSIFTNN